MFSTFLKNADIKPIENRVNYDDRKFYTEITTHKSSSSKLSNEFCPSMNARRPLITTDYETEVFSMFEKENGSIWLDMDYRDRLWKTKANDLLEGLVPVKYQPANNLEKCAAYNTSNKSVITSSCNFKFKSVCQSDGCK